MELASVRPGGAPRWSLGEQLWKTTRPWQWAVPVADGMDQESGKPGCWWVFSRNEKCQVPASKVFSDSGPSADGTAKEEERV